MQRNGFVSFLAVAVLLLSACSGGGGGAVTPGATPPPAIVKAYTFAPGHASATSGTAWDITGVTTTLTGQFGNGAGTSYDTLRVDVTFAQDIANALPAPAQMLSSGSQLGVGIGFDSDNNIATGNYKACDISSSAKPLEYFSDGGNDPSRLSDGNYSIIGPSGIPIYSGSPNPSSEAVTSVSGKVFTQSFFLPAINASSGAAIPKFGIIVGAINGVSQTLTDCVPFDGRIVLPVS